MAYKKSGETRGRILEAAASLFEERGYYDTSMGDIAREAGIGRASVYYHFEDKERVARALFDSITEQLHAAAARALGEDGDVLLKTLIDYLLLFKHIALNKATQAVYYDLVHFADYDKVNIERLKNSYFRDAKRLAAAYGGSIDDKHLVASILTSDAFAKALFKGILKGSLDFSLEEAMDYFCRHVILCEIRIPEAEYQAKLAEAFRICEGILIE